jgi:hypothetical protein
LQQRLISSIVATGFFVVLGTVLSFSGAASGDRPSIAGLGAGAALLLLAAPWRWRRPGYVAVWGFSLLITNNTLSANDESWNGLPGSLAVIALMVLSYWMTHRAEERERNDAIDNAPSAAHRPNT